MVKPEHYRKPLGGKKRGGSIGSKIAKKGAEVLIKNGIKQFNEIQEDKRKFFDTNRDKLNNPIGAVERALADQWKGYPAGTVFEGPIYQNYPIGGRRFIKMMKMRSAPECEGGAVILAGGRRCRRKRMY